jgi:phosphatidyl-myo-inositol alpha-mannosyltransferase
MIESPLRIAQVCPYSLTVPGGVQGQVLALARALRKLGHEARVLAPCDGPPPDAMVTPLGKSVPTATNGSMAPIAPDPACALRTIHALRNERFDVVHVHEPMAPGPSLTALVVSEAPLVGTFHAAGARTAYGYVPWLTRRGARRIAIRTAVSDEARLTAQSGLGGHYESVFNGIDVSAFADVEPWPSNTRSVFFVGRHEPRKGLGLLIDAMSGLDDDVELWIAGTGPQTASLKEITKDDSRIKWLGRISDTEKARRMKAATVFCAPSVEGESFGIVLLEAMAASTAVVASDLVGYRYVSREGADALLFKTGSERSLVDSLRTALSDNGQRERIVASGRSRADDFSIDRLASIYVDIYRRAIALKRK